MEKMTNTDRLHKEQILNKNKLSIGKIGAIDSLSDEEVKQLTSAQIKLGGGSDAVPIVGVPL